MPKPRKGHRRQELTFEQAASEISAAEAQARAESEIYSQAYEQCILQLRTLHAVMARGQARSVSARRRADKLRAIVDEGEGKAAPVFELIPNPMITQGLLDAVASGEVETQHQASIMAAKNHVILVGGLARVKNKTEAQFLAAARYCHLFEVSQIGPTKATDYEQVRVDTSGPRQDQVSGSQDDARRELEDARKALGARAASIVDQVVIHGLSLRSLARQLGMGEGGQARRRLEAELLRALDVLVDHFGLLTKSGKIKRWSDGSKAVIGPDAEEG